MTDIPSLMRLARELANSGRSDEAEATARRAVALDPNLAANHLSLGSLLRLIGRRTAAEAAYREALRLEPGFPSALFGLAKVLRDSGQVGEARELFEQVLTLDGSLSTFVQARLNLPFVYGSAEEITRERERYIATLQEALRLPGEIDPEEQLANSWFHLAYHGLHDRPIMEQLAQVLRAKAPVLREPANPLGDWRPPEGRRIRVGFVSMLLSDHTIGRLYEGIIAGLDRSRFEVVVAHLPRGGRDAMRDAISASADLAIDLPATLVAQRERLRRERLDVVVYPDVGMSKEGYLLAHARLAPVQAVSWGHPDTTGLASLDYFLSSDLIEATGAEEFYTERLVRFSRLPCLYAAPAAVPPLSRAEVGLPPEGRLYGCPQSLFKLHPEFDSVLADIVARDPQAWLVFIDGQRPSDREGVEARWAARHPAVAARARFLPRAPRARFLGLLGLMDVLLDPPHFGSGNTLYEAAAAAVPVVTWPGRFMRGRIVAGAYRQMGLADAPVVERLEDYAALAVAIACDPDRRARLGAQLRDRAAAALFDDTLALREFETFLEAAVTAAGRGEALPRGWSPREGSR